jgi:hypothetical protein
MTTVKLQKQRILDQMDLHTPGTKEYKDLIKQLALLNSTSSNSFSLDNSTVISSVAQVAGILLVLNFERLHILTLRS